MDAEAFWAFSLQLYGREGVASACIALQDTYGADIDVVLFTLWCARRGRMLQRLELDAIDAGVVSWRSAVEQPVRSALKPPPAAPFNPEAATALRERLLSAEFEAKRLQLAAMRALAPAPGSADPGQAASDHLACFARHAGIPPDAAPFASLLQAFP